MMRQSALLRNRQLLLFFVGRTTSLIGDLMLPVALTLVVLSAGYGSTGVGLVFAANMAPMLVFMLIGGVLADRFRPRMLMIAADLVRLVAYGFLAADVSGGRPALWQIAVLQAVGGSASAVFQPGVASVTPAIAPLQVREANAILRIGRSMARMIGPAIAGGIIAVAPPATVVGLDAATFGLSAACLGAIRMAGASRQDSESLWSGLVRGWREFRSRTWLWIVIVVFALLGLTVFGPFEVLGATVLTRLHGASGYGLMISLYGVGAIVGGLAGIRADPRYPLRFGALALVGYMPVLPMLAGGTPLWVTGGALALAGAASSLWAVMWATTLQTQIPSEILNRISSYDVTGSLLLFPAGGALAGSVGALFGAGLVLAVSAGCGVLGCAVLLSTPAVRRLPSRPAERASPRPTRMPSGS